MRARHRIISLALSGLLLCVVVLLSGCASGKASSDAGTSSAAATASRTKTFTSDKYKFSVTYDASTIAAASVQLPPADNLIVTFKFKSDFGAVWVIAGLTQRNVTPAYLRRILLLNVRSYSPEIERGPVKRVRVGGLPGLMTQGLASKTLRFATYAVGTGRHAYVISPQTNIRDWPRLQPTIDAIVGSFTVLK